MLRKHNAKIKTSLRTMMHPWISSQTVQPEQET